MFTVHQACHNCGRRFTQQSDERRERDCPDCRWALKPPAPENVITVPADFFETLVDDDEPFLYDGSQAER